MDEPRGLPLPVWVLIGFVISFVGLGGGVLVARAALDDEEGSATTALLAAPTSIVPATATTVEPATTTTATGSTTTTPAADTVALSSGLPDGFEWPHPDHPPFPFPAPAEVRGHVEDERHCDDDRGHDDSDDDDDESDDGGAACLQSYAFDVDVDDEGVTVDQVLAHLERAAPAAGWSPTDGAGAGADLAYTHSCGGGCHALVQIEVREPERRNRGPRLDVVVTFDDH